MRSKGTSRCTVSAPKVNITLTHPIKPIPKKIEPKIVSNPIVSRQINTNKTKQEESTRWKGIATSIVRGTKSFYNSVVSTHNPRSHVISKTDTTNVQSQQTHIDKSLTNLKILDAKLKFLNDKKKMITNKDWDKILIINDEILHVMDKKEEILNKINLIL